MGKDQPRKKRRRPSQAQTHDEANNSFLQKMTSKVSGMLTTTIDKWFNSSNPQSMNGSAIPADDTDSSSDDEMPAKRIRYNNSLEKNMDLISTEINSYNANTKADVPIQNIKVPSANSAFVRKKSFIPIHGQKSTNAPESEINTAVFSTRLSTADSVSKGLKRKSLFIRVPKKDPPESVQAPVIKSTETKKDLEQTCKPSTLGSPFYPGNTSYGGASTSYMNRPNIIHMSSTRVKNSNRNDASTMSSSTRRILDLLEQCSSPVQDAWRIKSSMVSCNTSSSPEGKFKSISSSQQLNSYKTRELYLPSMASILQLKKKSRLMDTTTAARQITASYSSNLKRKVNDTNNHITKIKACVSRPNRSNALMVTSSPANLPDARLVINQDNLLNISFNLDTPKSTPRTEYLNVTNTPSEPKSNESKNDDTQNAQFKFSSPVRLSTYVPNSDSPCSPLPQYTFVSPERNMDVPRIEENNDTPANNFNSFQYPLFPSVRLTTHTSSSTTVTGPMFTFANMVEKRVDVPTDAKKKIEQATGEIKASNESENKGKEWKCADCWVSNKPDAVKCVCCGGKAPAKTTSASLSASAHIIPGTYQSNSEPIVEDTDEVPQLPTTHITPPTTDQAKWKCDDCWVSNDPDVERCECCGAKNRRMKSKRQSTSPKSDWKCEECWISNKFNVKKCVCCGNRKPQTTTPECGGVIESDTKRDSNTDTLKVVKSKNPKWTCSTCMVENVKESVKCVCCESVRPDAPKEKNQFNYWKCEECWITNKSNVRKCACCGNLKPAEKPNTQAALPVKTAESGGVIENDTKRDSNPDTLKVVKSKDPKWMCSTCLVENVQESVKCVCCESIRPDAPKEKNQFNFGKQSVGFKFGVDWNTPSTMTSQPPSMSTHMVVPSQPSLSLHKEAHEQSETNNNVPTFTFTLPHKKVSDQVDSGKEKALEVPKSNFTFGAPKLSQSPTKKATDVATVPVKPVIETDKLKDTMSVVPEKKKVHSNSASPEQNAIDSKRSILPQPVTTATHIPSHNKFSFSGSGLKMATNLFSTPRTTSTVTMSFGASVSTTAELPTTGSPAPSSVFQKPETTPVSSALLFQLNSAPNTSTALFQTNEPSSTAAPVVPGTTGGTTSIFSFGSNVPPSSTPANTLQPVLQNKTKFNFNSGSGTKTDGASLFKPPSSSIFGLPAENTAPSNKFPFSAAANGLGASNTGSSLGGGNGLLVGNTVPSGSLEIGNGIPASATLRPPSELPADALNATNPLGGGNMQTGTNNANTGNIFGSNIQKENMWTPTIKASSNVFASSRPLSKPQKSSTAFTFGGMSFNNNNTPSPAFPSNSTAPRNLFGMSSPNNNAPVFSTSTPNMFGSPAPQTMFNAPIFGSLNTNTPSFDPSATTTPAPAFNFGSTQAPTVFGFGQQQPQAAQPPAPQAGMYNFGSTATAPAPVLFNMGSSPGATMRRVKKAVRRNPPR